MRQAHQAVRTMIELFAPTFVRKLLSRMPLLLMGSACVQAKRRVEKLRSYCGRAASRMTTCRRWAACTATVGDS